MHSTIEENLTGATVIKDQLEILLNGLDDVAEESTSNFYNKDGHRMEACKRRLFIYNTSTKIETLIEYCIRISDIAGSSNQNMRSIIL